jgi:hypothetical protein
MFLDEKITCPCCGAQRSLRSFQLSNTILDIAKLAGKFGSRWPWVLEYITGFQTDHEKPLKPTLMLNLLLEIDSIIEKRGFRFEKKDHAVRPDAMFQAMRQVALKNMTGLKNHHYLFKVAIDFNLKIIQAEETEQRKRAQEAAKRDPDAPERIRNLIAGIGGR